MTSYDNITDIYDETEKKKTTVIEPQQDHKCANSQKAILLYDLSVPVSYKTNVINKFFQNLQKFIVLPGKTNS